MTEPSTAPATKQDIALLMEEMRKMYVANEHWKEEVKLHFDVSVERIRDDIKIFGEQLQGHERRITRLVAA